MGGRCWCCVEVARTCQFHLDLRWSLHALGPGLLKSPSWCQFVLCLALAYQSLHVLGPGLLKNPSWRLPVFCLGLAAFPSPTGLLNSRCASAGLRLCSLRLSWLPWSGAALLHLSLRCPVGVEAPSANTHTHTHL